MLTRLTPVIIIFAALLRLASLWSDSISPLDPIPAIDQSILRNDSMLEELGVTGVEYQCFDPDAVVVVRPGLDSMPGVAGTDDNMNGIVDDRLELGATRSDDVCTVLTADQLNQIPRDEVMVLQRGSFVPANESEIDGRNWRAIVYGKSKEKNHWSLVVDSGIERTANRR